MFAVYIITRASSTGVVESRQTQRRGGRGSRQTPPTQQPCPGQQDGLTLSVLVCRSILGAASRAPWKPSLSGKGGGRGGAADDPGGVAAQAVRVHVLLQQRRRRGPSEPGGPGSGGPRWGAPWAPGLEVAGAPRSGVSRGWRPVSRSLGIRVCALMPLPGEGGGGAAPPTDPTEAENRCCSSPPTTGVHTARLCPGWATPVEGRDLAHTPDYFREAPGPLDQAVNPGRVGSLPIPSAGDPGSRKSRKEPRRISACLQNCPLALRKHEKQE